MSETPPSSYTHYFRWDSSVPLSVSIRGSFDNWQSSLELHKHPSGKFSAPIQLAYGTTVSYKYVVDGTWRHNPNEPTETDSNGNINNVFRVPQPPIPSMDPATDSASPGLNSATTMSSHALVEEPSENSPVQDVPKDSNPQIDAESNEPPDMSIVFPSTSSDQVPELIQHPKQPGGTKRTTSLFSAATRFARPSHRTTSLISSAPGTPNEKASPAGASVSNVVSALAGVAATAIPAAILAVTGKDITQHNSKQVHDPSTIAETHPPAQDSSKLSPTEAHPAGDVAPQKLNRPMESVAESSESLLQDQQITPLVVNDASNNPEPEVNEMVNASATHQILPESSTIPVQAESFPTPAQCESTLATNTGPDQSLPLTESSAVPIVLTPPSTAPELPTLESASALPDPLTNKPEPSTEQTKNKLEPSTDQSTDKLEPSTELPDQSTAAPTPIPPKEVQAEAKISTSSENVNVETSARVSFTEERPKTTQSPATTPPRASILIQSTSVSPPLGNDEAITATSVTSKNDQASLGTKSKKSEFNRKTSGWRYSVGSIRSRKTSGDIDRTSVANNNTADSTPTENDQSSSPRGKRMSGIFHKIKSALSPHKHQNNSATGENKSHGSKKRNSLGRTATITQT